MTPEEKEAIIQCVRDLNAGYANPGDPIISDAPAELGPVQIYTLSFKGADGDWHVNYVVKHKKKLRGVKRFRDLIPEVQRHLGFMTYVVPHARNLAIAFLAILLVGTLCGLAIVGKVKVEVLYALTTLVLGYLVGKGDRESINSGDRNK